MLHCTLIMAYDEHKLGSSRWPEFLTLNKECRMEVYAETTATAMHPLSSSSQLGTRTSLQEVGGVLNLGNMVDDENLVSTARTPKPLQVCNTTL